MNQAPPPFGIYVHVPFCARRCGYCDFTTFTNAELGGGGAMEEFPRWTMAELALARRVLDERWAREGAAAHPVTSVYFGGGTPTLLPSDALLHILDTIGETWLSRANPTPPGGRVEITVEANPDSVTPREIARLARAGVTRMSFGMQSADPAVLATLDRTHNPDHIPRAVDAAHGAGMDVSLDLIYGTPGETLASWEASVAAAVGYGIGHVSVYALTLEPHTPLARRIARGEVPAVDGDAQAERYELAAAILADAGLTWYEISNFARSDAERCRHNLGYWDGGEWWGIGPGAHSGFGGPAPVRWWNVKHPRRYAERLAAGLTPEAGRDEPDAAAQGIERVMLAIRLADGLPLRDVPEGGRGAIAGLIADGLIDPASALRGRIVLTLRGRLLADAVTRELIQ